MRRKNELWMLMAVVICSAMIWLMPVNIQAAKKNKVTYKVQKNTLIIQGKGAMSSQMKLPNEKRIKKIVVKKGVTYLPMGAFDGFGKVKEVVIANSVKKIGEGALPNSKYLKKVTMPGTFKLVTYQDDDLSYDLTWGNKPEIDTVCYNSKLDLKTVAYLECNNFVVSKKDPKYKSIKGVIYSKDGKSIVRVPAYRKSLTVVEGCEEFCFQAVAYSNEDYESDPVDGCIYLKKIVLPTSIKRVNLDKYAAINWDYPPVKQIVIKTHELDSESVQNLLSCFIYMKAESILNQLPGISNRDGMYIDESESNLIKYLGTAKEVVIPETVKKISKDAFAASKITKVTIPESVTRVEDAAFRNCNSLTETKIASAKTKFGKYVFKECENLVKAVLPEGMTEVPEGMFCDCYKLKDVTLPESITVIGKSAFSETDVPVRILEQSNVREVKDSGFYGVNWKSLVIPKTIVKVGPCGFGGDYLKKVTICGSTKDINTGAFFNPWIESPKVVLTYLSKVKEWQTGLDIQGFMITDKYVTNVELVWEKIAGVDGYQIQASSGKAFTKNVTTYTVKKSKTGTKLTKLKKNVRYFRIRPYKKVNGKKQFGRWDTIKRNN